MKDYKFLSKNREKMFKQNIIVYSFAYLCGFVCMFLYIYMSEINVRLSSMFLGLTIFCFVMFLAITNLNQTRLQIDITERLLIKYTKRKKK